MNKLRLKINRLDPDFHRDDKSEGAGGTSKGHPTARKKVRPAGIRSFLSTGGGNYE
jgi:hypothetical protein